MLLSISMTPEKVDQIMKTHLANERTGISCFSWAPPKSISFHCFIMFNYQYNTLGQGRVRGTKHCSLVVYTMPFCKLEKGTA